MGLTEWVPWIVMVQSGWSINQRLWSVLTAQSGWSINLIVEQRRRHDLAPQRSTSRWQSFGLHPLKHFNKNLSLRGLNRKYPD
jgi:hypothetical protein